MKLKGRVALIPGGTKGIGAEIARAYAQEGATVVISSRNKENVDQAVSELGTSGQAEGIVCDISDPKQIDDLVNQVVSKHGSIDVFLNSAGFYPSTPFEAVSTEELKLVMDINLIGPFLCAQAVAKQMIKQGSGRIIFLTSGQALRGVPLMAHYSAAKGGLVALARAMAAELGIYGITVNTIACGLTTTDTVNAAIPPEFMGMVSENVPLKRLASPEEYNDTAILLASDGGAYITGITIAVDGGTSQADAVHQM